MDYSRIVRWSDCIPNSKEFLTTISLRSNCGYGCLELGTIDGEMVVCDVDIWLWLFAVGPWI